jgi:hypothetical protein
MQRPLPNNTQHCQETDIHILSGTQSLQASGCRPTPQATQVKCIHTQNCQKWKFLCSDVELQTIISLYTCMITCGKITYIKFLEESCSHVRVCSSTSVYKISVCSWDCGWEVGCQQNFFFVQAPPASVKKLGKSDTPLLPTEYKSLSSINF